MALQGAGTEVDPWRITTMAEFLAVVRDAGGQGFYRIVNNIDNGNYVNLSPLNGNTAALAPKVIDGDGYAVRLLMSHGTNAYPAVLFFQIHFRNLKVHVSASGSTSSSTFRLFMRCSLEDVVTYVKMTTTTSLTTQSIYNDASMQSIIPKALKRLVLMLEGAPTSPVIYFVETVNSGSGITPSQCYVYSTSGNSSLFTKRTSALDLATLDSLTAKAFSDNNWWQDGVELLPYQSEQVALTLQVIADGQAASRRIWLEGEKWQRYLGDCDAAGNAQFTVRIRKWSAFTLLASEDFGADDLRADKVIAANAWYLPPVDNDYVYQAGSAGRVTSLAGVVFNDLPVTIDGIVFTPRPVYKAAASSRRSVARHTAVQNITLNNGGGATYAGDPAYLEGVVEEVHPMTGLRRALANVKVAAFELRGEEYVPMGAVYSDGIGGFHLETEVYGGGDVFAFAADYPGVIFEAGIALHVGDRIRPAQANGYVYEIVDTGTADAEEPTWWPDLGEGTEGDIGTARARARPYYQPVGHGPLKMTPI